MESRAARDGTTGYHAHVDAPTLRRVSSQDEVSIINEPSVAMP
jgi:hypothetical protein